MTYTKNQKAVLLLRLLFGVLFLMAAMGKFKMGIPQFADYIVNGFQATLLPKALLLPFGYALPFVELLLGITLLLGLFSETMLVVSAVTLLTLFFGMVLKQESGVAANNALYVFINICLLRWFEHVPLSIDVITRKKKAVSPPS